LQASKAATVTYRSILLVGSRFHENHLAPPAHYTTGLHFHLELFSRLLPESIYHTKMDEITHEDALIAQFSGIASVPASEVRRLQVTQ
jgi:hypothetical protein